MEAETFFLFPSCWWIGLLFDEGDSKTSGLFIKGGPSGIGGTPLDPTHVTQRVVVVRQTRRKRAGPSSRCCAHLQTETL